MSFCSTKGIVSQKLQRLKRPSEPSNTATLSLLRWTLSYFVGALSPVRHKGLHQGWTQTSLYLQVIHFTSHHTTNHVDSFYRKATWNQTDALDENHLEQHTSRRRRAGTTILYTSENVETPCRFLWFGYMRCFFFLSQHLKNAFLEGRSTSVSPRNRHFPVPITYPPKSTVGFVS